MGLTAAAAACNFNVPLTAESPGSHRLSFLIHPYTGALTWTPTAMCLLAVGVSGSSFRCVRSSNAQIGGQTPTFDRNTAVSLGGSLVQGGLNGVGLCGHGVPRDRPLWRFH